ncbi:MAG: ADP-ribosylglycohydrolase family protein [Syntrophales bacterium]
MAVNLGDDADTTGAIYGQIAGGYYGEKGISDLWLSKVIMLDFIRTLANSSG